MRVVRIAGTAPNLARMTPTPPGWELWCANRMQTVRSRLSRIIDTGEWTRWFNLHSRAHMERTYPATWEWYSQQTKPIVCQKTYPELPSSEAFPIHEVMAHFAIGGVPNRYFTFQGALMMAYAGYLGFDRIELPGFMVSKTKPKYMWERPCFFYWVTELRRRGHEVVLAPEVEWDGVTEIGDPTTYHGVVYGYGTKPETPPIVV